MQTKKLYSPLEFYIHNPREEEANGEYGTYDLYDKRYRIHPIEILEYMDAIELAVRRDRDRMDQRRGMAEYLSGTLGEKVEAMFPAIEIHEETLSCVAEVTLRAPLTAEEKSELKDWWSGQLSDGWGEGFEQREINIGGGEELYIKPWTSDESMFFIDTQAEFNWRIGAGTPIAERDHALAEFIRNAERPAEHTINHGFAMNAVDALLAFTQEAASKSMNGWAEIVAYARDIAVDIAEYADLEPPFPHDGWLSGCNAAIQKARVSPDSVLAESRETKESGIRGLAWYACEMTDKDASGLSGYITGLRDMMSRLIEFWGFDQSLNS